MKYDEDSFIAAILAHDAAIASFGLDIWIGAEPTFTNRMSEAPEWLTDALGETKLNYACRFIKRLRDNYPNSIILRTVGRQYPGEQRPRWNLGLYHRRDGRPLADGLPADPLRIDCSCDSDNMLAFWQRLTEILNHQEWKATGFQVDGDMGMRVLLNCDAHKPVADPHQDPRLTRASLQEQAIPDSGIVDDLATEGLYLISLGCAPTGADNKLQPCIELPAFKKVATFIRLLRSVAQASVESGINNLVWRGYPPPVDADVAWTTLTPDPAVVEVNEAPAKNISEFLEMSRHLYSIAAAEELAPYRLQYNGVISESGGGGQFTIGGPSPESSPFFQEPQLMTRMVSYLNHHPAISYWFAPLYVGSFSQSPRADENVLESFAELQVALQHLAAVDNPEPEFIWRSLSPFLVDTSGNAHRSEMNIEKLWNPYLPERGCLGLVEFRAFRMSIDAETATAIASMLRALVAMLSMRDSHDQLIEWGSQLHDRFALPFYLCQDLHTVFNDLDTAGLGLGWPIKELLLANEWRQIGGVEYCGARLDVEQAIEFWPLLGDSSEQEGGSRLVDASTTRLQLTLRGCSEDAVELQSWQLCVNGYYVPLRQEQDEAGSIGIIGLRYRAFVPWAGLHPGLGAQGPIVLTLLSRGMDKGLRITLHDWQPQGEPYNGLPDSLEEARRRIAERFVIEEIAAEDIAEIIMPPATALTEYCLDLRRI